MYRPKLGEKARHKISGFEGIVTGHAEYLTGCDRYQLLPEGVDKDGKPREAEWFDDSTLEGVAKTKKNGGPSSNPPQRADAVR